MRNTTFFSLFVAGITLSGTSLADDKETCLDAVSKGQRFRDTHKLVQAREQFRVCAAATCPAVVQTDCAQWLDSVDKALDVLRQDHADLITMDVRMPGRSGLEALKILRESNEYNNTPVIMITGYASLDGVCEALRLGATDYLQKPFGIDQLKTSVRNGLRRHESVRLPDLQNGHENGNGKPAENGKASAQENLDRGKTPAQLY